MIRGRTARTLVAALLVGLSASAILAAAPTAPAATPAAPATAPAAPAAAVINQGQESPFVAIVKQAAPAIVNIDVEAVVTRSVSGLPDDPFFKQFFGDMFREYTRQVPMKGAGSGFVVSSDGRILTNNHVIADAKKITVTFSDGTTKDAKVIGRDPTFDLAVIKVDGKNLPTLPLGDSASAEVGSWVVAIGNPLGLGVEPTVTVGVLSAKNRSIRARDFSFDGFLQTDAAINPGNSGGPLLNIHGQVIGINTAIAPMAQGIGFAIPIDMAKQVMNDIVTYGRVRRGQLGVYLQPLTPVMANAMGLKDVKGSLVASVAPDSPAASAGIRRGDVITSVDGKPVASPTNVSTRIREHIAGDTVSVTVYRDGSTKSFSVKLKPIDEPLEKDSQETVSKLGISVTKLTPELRKNLNLAPNENGLVITKVENGSVAAFAGLQPDDLILQANGRNVTTADELARAVGNQKAVVLLVLRDGMSSYVTLQM